jgi:hypothetical protein
MSISPSSCRRSRTGWNTIPTYGSNMATVTKAAWNCALILAGAMNTGKALSYDHYMAAYKQLLPMVCDHSKADEEVRKKAGKGMWG